MTRCHLMLCLWASLLWTATEGRPSSVEQLSDGTDVMLSSMGMVEGADQQHQLDQVPDFGWQQPAGGPLPQLADNIGTEDGTADDNVALQQLLWRLQPSVPSMQPPRQRRSGSGGSGGSGSSGTQHQQLTRQLLRRFKELQKRSYPYRSDLFRQARGYMCLSKVCNFKGARGK